MFWDSSALVPLLFPEARSAEIASVLSSDGEPVIWWSSPLECQSAIHRRNREDPLPREALQTALDRLDALIQDVDTVAPSEEVRRRAGRLLSMHPLRTADAFQLAAALLWCEEDPSRETFVCLDDRLLEAARREGFRILPT